MYEQKKLWKELCIIKSLLRVMGFERVRAVHIIISWKIYTNQQFSPLHFPTWNW